MPKLKTTGGATDAYTSPSVSIGMPVYNGAKYIREALDSLLAQTFVDFELIISDNASTDSTPDICREYAGLDARIRYVRQDENRGPLANFQFVFSEARGKYFMWAAHDDRWASTFLKRTVAVLERDAECGLVFSHYIERNLENGNEKFHRVKSSDSASLPFNYLTRMLHMCPSLIYGLFRVNMIENMKLENFDFADVYFVSSLGLRATIRVIDDYLYIAGVKGSRIPYSLTHKKIYRTTFLRKQYALLQGRFCFPVALFLFFILCGVMLKNKILLWRY